MKTDIFREDFYNVSFILVLKGLLCVLQILCYKFSFYDKIMLVILFTAM